MHLRFSRFLLLLSFLLTKTSQRVGQPTSLFGHPLPCHTQTVKCGRRLCEIFCCPNEVPDLKICTFSWLHQIWVLLKQVLLQFLGKRKFGSIRELEMHKFRFHFLVQDAKMDFEFFCNCFLLHLFPVSQQRISTTLHPRGPFI